MADLIGTNADQPVGITGLNSSGVPTNPVNADSNGNLQVKDFADGTKGSSAPSTAIQVAGPDPSGNLQSPTVHPLSTQVVAADQGLVVNAVIHGLTTAGGGSYVDVKVNPSGSLETAIGDISGVVGQQTMAASLPVTIASNQSAVPASQSGTWTVQQGTPPWTVTGTGTAGTPAAGVITVQGIAAGTPAQILPLAPVSTNSYPNPLSAYPLANANGFKNDYNLTLDVFDNLQVRGPAITDEGSFRDDFSGTSLYTSLTGNVKFANNSPTVTGTGTTFTTQVNSGFYIKATADAESFLTQISFVQDDGTLSLVSNYGANENNVAAQISRYKIVTAATAGTTSVSSSLLNLSSGTASGGTSYIQNTGDYPPYVFETYAAINQRIANQTTIIGLEDNAVSPTKQAIFQFDGTTNTTVKCISAFSSAAADIQTQTITLPNGGNTSTFHTYEIDISNDSVDFFIDGQLVASNTIHMPGPYDVMSVVAYMNNSAVVTATTLQLDYILWDNVDRLNVANDFGGQPLPEAPQLAYNTTLPTAISGRIVPAQSDQNGRLLTLSSPSDGSKATYSASIIGLVPATLATDIFTITGSASKTVRVTHLEISATQTTAGAVNTVLLKRSTANSGGTSTNPTKVPHDSQSAAATATINAYTANPTTGTLVGQIRSNKIFISTATTLGQEALIDFGNRPGQAIVLRGTGEVLAINLNGVTVSGASFDIDLEWSEE